MLGPLSSHPNVELDLEYDSRWIVNIAVLLPIRGLWTNKKTAVTAGFHHYY
ncbi:hypothetical protein KR51_00033180 [Rubidibacter lacunae KORDI 51-2]|uniref:Uncharacterized protein n=1 Tax=Rubidibacter lacunae KORDI 51-2 TaxID=582515 RepID=U5DHI0_9CHRO|nr:hypothetical protein KR51_00033180 [Rubidibacter lacunae KORDI 51-2]